MSFVQIFGRQWTNLQRPLNWYLPRKILQQINYQAVWWRNLAHYLVRLSSEDRFWLFMSLTLQNTLNYYAKQQGFKGKSDPRFDACFPALGTILGSLKCPGRCYLPLCLMVLICYEIANEAIASEMLGEQRFIALQIASKSSTSSYMYNFHLVISKICFFN